MKIDYETVYDLITLVRLKANEDELDIDEALDLLEKEINQREYEDF